MAHGNDGEDLVREELLAGQAPIERHGNDGQCDSGEDVLPRADGLVDDTEGVDVRDNVMVRVIFLDISVRGRDGSRRRHAAGRG